MYGLSSNGWMDTELFEIWFKHHFLMHVPSCRPILLMMDGHSTHFQPSVVRMAAKEEVILFCLPPHSTHLTQPLDKGCFGPLKFIPVLYSPAIPAQSKSMLSSRLLLYDFSEEVAIFKKRYSEECDLTHDPHYNYWVQLKSDEGAMKDRMFSEPDIIEDSNLQKDAITSKDISKESGVDSTKMDCAREEPMQLKHTTTLSKVLSAEELAVVKVTTKLPKTSACVLTSSENMKILEEKEKKKQEEADEKKKHKIAAEEKRKENKKLKRSEGKKGCIMHDMWTVDIVNWLRLAILMSVVNYC